VKLGDRVVDGVTDIAPLPDAVRDELAVKLGDTEELRVDVPG
jgi:hypothetical protein